MEEKLYTIDVNDVMRKNVNSDVWECPFCSMYEKLERDAINFTLGPSYMEDDIRLEMDKKGFCGKHVKMLYKGQNRLGLALMLKSQLERETKELEKTVKKPGNVSFFKKKEDSFNSRKYISDKEAGCYVCDRIDRIFERYVVTVFYLYSTESDFRTLFSKSKGLCREHFLLCYEKSMTELKKEYQDSFVENIKKIYFGGMEENLADLSWFIDKFDYRNADKPWNNSRDVLQRLGRIMFKNMNIDE